MQLASSAERHIGQSKPKSPASRPGFLLPNRRRHLSPNEPIWRVLQAQSWTCDCGRQGTTAFHQFRTLEVQRFRQQFSDRSGLYNECVDLSDFLGGELAPPLGDFHR
jgi:hypothetical protein